MRPLQFKDHSVVRNINSFVECPLEIKGVSMSNDMKLLEMIYTNDNGEINGDLSMFLTKETNEGLRKYIIDNLLLRQSPSQNYDLSDDEMLSLSRSELETDEQYIGRLREVLNKSSANE